MIHLCSSPFGGFLGFWDKGNSPVCEAHSCKSPANSPQPSSLSLQPHWSPCLLQLPWTDIFISFLFISQFSILPFCNSGMLQKVMLGSKQAKPSCYPHHKVSPFQSSPVLRDFGLSLYPQPLHFQILAFSRVRQCHLKPPSTCCPAPNFSALYISLGTELGENEHPWEWEKAVNTHRVS